MAYTLLGNVYVPHHFTREIIQLTAVSSALWTSGIIGADPQLAGKAKQGGRLVDMPFWNDLTGNSQRLNSGTTLTVNAVTSSKDQAVIFESGTGFGTEDLAAIMAQTDPMAVIQARIADWWGRDLQDTLISILKGIFAAPSMAPLLLEIHHTTGGSAGADEDNWLNASSIIRAEQLMGDKKGVLTALVMHSAVHAALDDQDLIDFEKQSDGTSISTFRGHRVILDDRCPTETVDGDTVYTTYFFAPGCVGYEEDTEDRVPLGAIGTWYYEESRNAAQSLSALFTRKRCLFHVRGVKFTDAASPSNDTSPTNAQFEDPDNWELVYTPKNMRLAAIKHNIPQA
jgi:hypothetical protein